MKWAWVQFDKIRDICPEGDPALYYHPLAAKNYATQVPDEARNGDFFIAGKLVKQQNTPNNIETLEGD